MSLCDYAMPYVRAISPYLPGKPISRDNWRTLQQDSTSDDSGLAKLGISPTDVRGKLHAILGTAA